MDGESLRLRKACAGPGFAVCMQCLGELPGAFFIYPFRMVISRFLQLLVCLSFVFVWSPAEAQTKSKPACGFTLLPLAEGNTWTYEYVPGPYEDEAEEKLRKNRRIKRGRRPLPIPPLNIKITVTSVKNVSGGKEIKLKEVTTYKNPASAVTRDTNIRCDAEGVFISPQSFFYAGEPGGGLLIDLKLKKSIRKTFPRPLPKKWQNTAEYDFVYKTTPKSGIPEKKGTMGIDQSWEKLGQIELTIGEITYKKVFMLKYEFTGEIVVEGLKKKGYIPEGAVGYMWFKPTIGPLRIFNSSAHAFELTVSNLLPDEKK